VTQVEQGDVDTPSFSKKKESTEQPDSATFHEETLERERLGCLGVRKPQFSSKKTLVLDLDETLVHSSFKLVPDADFCVPVNFEGVRHKVYVRKRPGTDLFLAKCAENYEIVLFTASLSKYADPLLDMLDTKTVIEHRLFREDCDKYGYTYVKNLNRLGRKLEDTIIIDNSPQSYLYHPENAIPIPSWFDDQSDTALIDLIPAMEKLATIPDVRSVLDAASKSFRYLIEWGRK